MYEIIFFLLSLFLGFFYSYILKKLRILDKPDTFRKLHNFPVPPAGGFVILTVLILYLVFFELNIPNLRNILFLLILFGLGLLDDLFDLPVIIKLFVQFSAAILLCFKKDIALIMNLFNIIFYTAFINSVNFIDNYAASCLSFLLFAFILIYLSTFNILFLYLVFSVLSLIILNALLGILFLGNNGSFLSGGILVVCIDYFLTRTGGALNSYVNAYLYLLQNFFFLLFPFVDFVYVIIRRINEGAPIYKGDRRHLIFTIEKLVKSDIYSLVVWCLMLFITFALNIVVVKNNIPYIYYTPE
jgi:UDP-GlcNAc:undecaprenyl-phosphate/decaprenyl-phosphate GlcNAc-1-phosphate transferase